MGSDNIKGFQFIFTGGINANVDQSDVKSNVRK